MKSLTDKIASEHLGKKSVGSDRYNSSLLVAVPRIENRKQYNIDDSNLPFAGQDVWHCYEFSAMCENGLPVTRVLKLKYICENDFIIESKSLKLYLNSFNMSKFGKDTEECLKICGETIKKDLSEKLKTDVEVSFLDENAQRVEIFSGFQNIMNFVDENSLKITDFKESPEVLKCENSQSVRKLFFNSLRSNCRVTHQPDFGDVYIYYKSEKHILENSLVKYLCSFRTEFHFHEECCEMIFKRLCDLLNQDDELMVCCLYTRRGGIDICPVRYKNCLLKDVLQLTDTKIFARKGIKQ